MSDLANQFMRSHFGLGSSTRGMTMDEANRGRTEAEARAERAAKPRVRVYQGETVERALERNERDLFRKNRLEFDLAISTARAALEDANLGSDAVEDFNNIMDDFAARWRVDPRAED